MKQSDRSGRTVFLVLRAMRRPIIVLMVVYAASMLGWSLIPGPAEHGGEPLSLFHAFYFLTYTATTTGFGEIPYSFTDAQRVWSIISLYAGVLAWIYAAGTIIALINNPHFRAVAESRRFAKRVSRLNEPFVLLCGFGNTGSLLTRGLSNAGIPVAIIDTDPDRTQAVTLRDYRVAVHVLCADASLPDHLIEAGVESPLCQAVVALTGDEEINLKVAISARLLNPKASVIVRSTSDSYEEVLATLGGNTRIVDPFQTFARYLVGTIHTPKVYTLYNWLLGVPGSRLGAFPQLPQRHWILCGHGRMGRRLQERFAHFNVPTVFIDPSPWREAEVTDDTIAGPANQDILRQAKIEEAVGIVSATNNDSVNLSLLLNAKALNPNVFSVVRQNSFNNAVLFDAADADLVMQPSLVAARRITYLVTAPLLRNFFAHARQEQSEGSDFLDETIARLERTVGGERRPGLLSLHVSREATPALLAACAEGYDVTLHDILRDPRNRLTTLPCVPLVKRSEDRITVMPSTSDSLHADDEVLLCGTRQGLSLLSANLQNPYTLQYLISGRHPPQGHVFRWLSRRWLRAPAPVPPGQAG